MQPEPSAGFGKFASPLKLKENAVYVAEGKSEACVSDAVGSSCDGLHCVYLLS